MNGDGRRAGAITGIVAAVVLVVGFVLPGTPPKASDSTAKITSFLVDKRGSVLAGMLLIGLGMAFFTWWLGVLRAHLKASGDDPGGLADAAFGGGLLGAALTLAGAALFAATVFKVAKLGDMALNRALFDMTGDLFAIAGFGFAVLIGAGSAAGARTGALPGWLAAAGFVIAVISLVSNLALVASSGLFAAGEAFGFIAFFAGLLWIVAVSAVMMRGATGPKPSAG